MVVPAWLPAVNRTLRYAVLFSALFLLAEPLLPLATTWLTRSLDRSSGYRYQSAFAQRAGIDQAVLEPFPGTENRLVIPAIGVDAPVLEGSSPTVLDRGVWRRPNASSPDRGGNTVLTAHRFLRTFGPNTFYLLDHLRPGDPLAVFWNGQEYHYVVESSETVSADMLSVEAPSSTPLLTLYTCTPLWTSTKRLVVRARPLPMP